MPRKTLTLSFSVLQAVFTQTFFTVLHVPQEGAKSSPSLNSPFQREVEISSSMLSLPMTEFRLGIYNAFVELAGPQTIKRARFFALRKVLLHIHTVQSSPKPADAAELT